MTRSHKVVWREQYVSCLLWSGRSTLTVQRRPSGHEKKDKFLDESAYSREGFIGYKDLEVIVPQLLVKDHNVAYNQQPSIIIIIIIINLPSSCGHISTSHSLTWIFHSKFLCWICTFLCPIWRHLSVSTLKACPACQFNCSITETWCRSWEQVSPLDQAWERETWQGLSNGFPQPKRW